MAPRAHHGASGLAQFHPEPPIKGVYDEHDHLILEDWSVDKRNALGDHIDTQHTLVSTNGDSRMVIEDGA